MNTNVKYAQLETDSHGELNTIIFAHNSSAGLSSSVYSVFIRDTL